jgi:VWFA-related protein
VTTFSSVDIPFDVPPGLAPGHTAEPDVRTNAAPEGRTYLIALDEVSPDRVLRARHFVRRFVEEHLGPNDVAAVALTGRGLASSGQDFTGNRRLILDAVEKFSGGFEPSTPNTQGDGPGVDRAFSSDARQLASSLRTLAEFLASLPGRKTLLYVGEGLGGLDFNALVNYNGSSLTPAEADAHAAVAAATRGNVTIYPVDPRGLTTDLTAPGEASESLESRADLAVLAEVTGGFSVANTNDLGAAFNRVVRENSTYYTIGFASEYVRRDGRFVSVEVRVRRPGLQVRSRDGYVAPLGEERRPDRVDPDARFAAVADALGSAVAARGIPLRVFAAPYKRTGDRSTIALAVEIDVSTLGFDRRDDALTSAIEISYFATDSTGKIHPGRRHTATLVVEPEAREQVFQHGVRVLSEFELPDGRYQVRVAAGSDSRAGSVVYDLEVPDFRKGPLAMSGISLTSAAAVSATTLRPHDPIGDALPAPPIASRDFARDDRIVLFAEVYDNRRTGRNESPPPIELTAMLLSGRGRVVRVSSLETGALPVVRPGSDGQGFTTQLLLDGLDAGSYVIQVDARSGDAPVVSRSIPIRVR